jgi:hypothetical protein
VWGGKLPTLLGKVIKGNIMKGMKTKIGENEVKVVKIEIKHKDVEVAPSGSFASITLASKQKIKVARKTYLVFW